MPKGEKLTKEQASAMGKKGGPKNKGKLKPSTVAKIEAREALRKMIEADTEELYAAWKDTALGHFIQVKTAQGDVKVYKKSPNGQAINDMFNRAFGKAKQEVDVTSGGEKIVSFQYIIPKDEECGDSDQDSQEAARGVA